MKTKIGKSTSYISKRYKSINPVKIDHERGADIINIEGTVLYINHALGIVYLRGLSYDFSITSHDYRHNNRYQHFTT